MKLEDIREQVIEYDLGLLEAQGSKNMDVKLFFSTNDEALAYHGSKRAEYLLRLNTLLIGDHSLLDRD